jgi:hypothetical protein
MATNFFNFAEHAVAGSSSLIATDSGAHIRNIVAAADIDNGCIVGKGAWISMEKYEEAEAGAFTGVILDKAANGNWYVEVKTAENAWLVLTDPLIYEEYTTQFTQEKYFYNAKGDIMRCYELKPYDIFELSAAGFDGEPTKGATVSVKNKMVAVD